MTPIDEVRAPLPSARPGPTAVLSAETCALLSADPAAAEALRRLRTADRSTGVELGTIVLIAAHRRRTLTADLGGYRPPATTTSHGSWVTTKEAGRLIGRSDRTIRDAIDAGKLPSRRNAYGLHEVNTVDLAGHAARPARTPRSRPVPAATDTTRRDAEAAVWQQILDNGAHLAEADRVRRQLRRVATVLRDGSRGIEQEIVRFLTIRAEAVELVGQLVDAADHYGLAIDQALPDGWAGPGTYSDVLDRLAEEIGTARASTARTWRQDAIAAGEHATAVRGAPVAWFCATRSTAGLADPWTQELAVLGPDLAVQVESAGRVLTVYDETATRAVSASMSRDRAAGPIHQIDESLAHALLDEQNELGRSLTSREAEDRIGTRAALLGDPTAYRGLTEVTA